MRPLFKAILRSQFGETLNDYSIGAIEALSWARAIMKKCRSEADYARARRDVEEMLMRLASGTAVSFRDKAELIREL